MRTVGVSACDGTLLAECVLGRWVSTRARKDDSVLELVAAFDVTFSLSKSVSVFLATATEDRVRHALVAYEAAVERRWDT